MSIAMRNSVKRRFPVESSFLTNLPIVTFPKTITARWNNFGPRWAFNLWENSRAYTSLGKCVCVCVYCICVSV